MRRSSASAATGQLLERATHFRSRARAAHSAPGALASEACALRLVLVVALDRPRVASCLGLTEESFYWPSTLYAWAAEAAVRSPVIWARCAEAIELELASHTPRYRDRSVAYIAELLASPDTAGLLATREIASALWVLTRRRDPRLLRTVQRLAREAEVNLVRFPSRRTDAHPPPTR